MRYGLQYDVVRPWSTHDLPLHERLLSDVLHDAGYATAIVGKWHLGHVSRAYLPTRRGFDRQYGHYNGMLDYFTHDRHGGHDWHRDDRSNHDEGYTTDLIGEEAARIIGAHDTSQLLFLYVPFNAPHTPLQSPEKYLKQYEHVGDRKRRIFAAMVTCMDAAVGKIVNTLEKHHFPPDRTLIFFCSDNGGIPRRESNGQLRGRKSTLYEGGVRVPAVAVWEGVLRPGKVVDEPLHIVDMYPTLIGLAGGKTGPATRLDGRDAWPTITAGKKSPHDIIVHNITPFHGAIRVGDWKLIDNGPLRSGVTAPSPESRLELFNIRQDPFEKKDVKGDHPEILQRLRTRIEELRGQSVKLHISPRPIPPDFKVPAVWGQGAAIQRLSARRASSRAIGITIRRCGNRVQKSFPCGVAVRMSSFR